MNERDIAIKAFSSDEWLSAAEALFQATGVQVAVMDFKECTTLSAGHKCTYCHLATDIGDVGPLSCFDSCPGSDSGPGRVVCRAGLASLYAPVTRGDRIVAHAVLSGFVTSTRERRGLYERLLARSVSEDSARRAVKALPVIARRQADSYLQMAVASARTVLDATAERFAAAERVEELRLFVSAGHQAVSTDRLDASALAGITAEAVALIGGEAGAILRPKGTFLEVVAHTETWRGTVGATVPRASTAAGRAVQTGRTVVAPGKAGTATLAMPLTMGSKVLGVLEVRLAQARLPLPQDRVARLNRFGQFIAIAVERDDERAAVDRAMTGYAQLNELAAALGGQTDTRAVADLLTRVLGKAYDVEMAGLVLTGWGNDRACVVVHGEVTTETLSSVLGTASARDVNADPFDSVQLDTHAGSVVDGDEAGDIAMALADLRYGDLDVGALFLARSGGERFCAQDQALLEGIAAHGAAAFGRAALFSRIRDDYAKTIAALSATLDLGERVPSGHAGRVMEYAMSIGRELGLGFDDVEQLRFAGLLHDIGKSGVPEEILLKPSGLTPEEFEKAKKHTEIGASIVDQIEFLKGLTPIILHHHERWDGKGYPAGLKGDKIPLLARVLAVADAFDAMTTKRAYAEQLTIGEAKAELEAGAGTQFDPRVVAALFEVLDTMATAGATGLFALTDLPSDQPPLPS